MCRPVGAANKETLKSTGELLELGKCSAFLLDERNIKVVTVWSCVGTASTK